jgi:hypothetical protein
MKCAAKWRGDGINPPGNGPARLLRKISVAARYLYNQMSTERLFSHFNRFEKEKQKTDYSTVRIPIERRFKRTYRAVRYIYKCGTDQPVPTDKCST